MKIVCVCGMGLGSSVIAKMNIEEVLKTMKMDASVETCDLGSVRGVPADIYVTTRELAGSMPEEYESKTVVLMNFVRKADVESALREHFEKRD